MSKWLMKCEPDEFSIDDLREVGKRYWKSVRNYQVRNMMRDQFKVGDEALFYHSNSDPTGVAGTLRIASEAYIDPFQFDPDHKKYDPKSTKDNPRWLNVDVEFVSKLPRIVELQEMKAEPALDGMQVLAKGNRLSITSVTEEQWAKILELAEREVAR